MIKSIKQICLFLTILIIFIFVGNSSVFAATSTSTKIRIDRKTITKGYTILHDNDKLKFAVTAGQVNQEVSVQLENRIITKSKPLPKNKKIASKVYSFDMLGLKYNPIITKRPSWIAIKHFSKTNNNKAIYYWDSNKNQWIMLPSSPDSKNEYIRAITHLPWSWIVVLEDTNNPNIDEGQASWFGAPKMTAAMNKYNFGDKVKVTRVDTGKSIIVTIDDRGPFVAGRIIDLSADAFALLAPLSQGIMNVKVEKL